ncbi:MAG: response regulator, partial [Oscillospiraceae bacterium]
MPTVLFLDDEASFLRINRVYFESRGYTVLTADRFDRMKQLLHEHEVDCIVLDVLMPGIDGWEVCRRLKKECDTPIVFLTSLSEQECLYRGFELGADDYMTNPYEFRELELRIKARLRPRGTGA